MDGGQEIDTWPIVAELMSRGCRVAVPKVCGRQPTDMRMLRLASLEQAQSFPLTKWGIPEPDAATQAAMEDATEANDLSVLFVPAVAFDARCGRLGHGRGYYDAFIARQRALARGSGNGAADKLTVIGLALSEQVVESVPMVDGHDQRLDFVLTPDGPLAYTSAADVAKAAAMMGGGAAIGVAAAAGSTAAAEAAEADFSDDELAPVKPATPSVPDLASRVEIAKGGCSLPPVRVTIHWILLLRCSETRAAAHACWSCTRSHLCPPPHPRPSRLRAALLRQVQVRLLACHCARRHHLFGRAQRAWLVSCGRGRSLRHQILQARLQGERARRRAHHAHRWRCQHGRDLWLLRRLWRCVRPTSVHTHTHARTSTSDTSNST